MQQKHQLLAMISKFACAHVTTRPAGDMFNMKSLIINLQPGKPSTIKSFLLACLLQFSRNNSLTYYYYLNLGSNQQKMEKSSYSQNVGSSSVGGGEEGGDSSSSCDALMYDTSFDADADADVQFDILDSILDESNYGDLDKVASLLDRGADPNCNDSSVGKHKFPLCLFAYLPS
jgi:hypothetical protein